MLRTSLRLLLRSAPLPRNSIRIVRSRAAFTSCSNRECKEERAGARLYFLVLIKSLELSKGELVACSCFQLKTDRAVWFDSTPCALSTRVNRCDLLLGW